ncbi:MAG: YdbL family protein, partial [Proteobacteria bacterium]|nr:YdbL family protein [Pseudomonadota bacterium]
LKPLWMAATLMAIALFACVTINIYFPAEKVESVAGDIVDDIRGKKPSQNGGQSWNREDLFHEIRLAFLPASAWADDVITVSNPTIRALKETMKARFQQLKPYYQKGALNEGDNGYLSVADAGGLNLKEKRDLNGLADAENNDRKTLYAEVAKALKIDPGQINRIAEIFAKEWQKPVR